MGPIPTATEREWIKLNILSEVCGARHFFCDNPINIAIGIAALAEGGFCDLTLLQTKVGLLFHKNPVVLKVGFRFPNPKPNFPDLH